MNAIENKIEMVKARIKPLEKAVVGFSGGKDSFFLLKNAVETLGKDNVKAFFVKTPFSTGNDEKRVDYFCDKLDFHLHRMFINVTEEHKIMGNPKDRCYFCKTKIFGTLKQEAARLGIHYILDGTTFSDLDEYRPGLKALEELEIVSPLQEAEISSGEIIEYLEKELNIKKYYLTSSTCLATRFPYDFRLNETLLKHFDELESYFVEMDIYPVKIRYIKEGIRIETPADCFQKVLENRGEIVAFCKERDFKFVTLDLEGIKSGVWD